MSRAEYQEHILAGLDSALNRWLESIPDHCELLHVGILRSQNGLQCVGIPIVKICCFLINLFYCIRAIITLRF